MQSDGVVCFTFCIRNSLDCIFLNNSSLLVISILNIFHSLLLQWKISFATLPERKGSESYHKNILKESIILSKVKHFCGQIDNIYFNKLCQNKTLVFLRLDLLLLLNRLERIKWSVFKQNLSKLGNHCSVQEYREYFWELLGSIFRSTVGHTDCTYVFSLGRVRMPTNRGVCVSSSVGCFEIQETDAISFAYVIGHLATNRRSLFDTLGLFFIVVCWCLCFLFYGVISATFTFSAALVNPLAGSLGTSVKELR